MENTENILKGKMAAAAETMKGSSRGILIVTHIFPDGDCLSSACALSLWLESIGKKHALFCADPLPESFLFLPNAKKFSQKASLDDFDVVAILDCACLSRTGLVDDLVQARGKIKTIEIDHHPKSEDYADIEIRLPERSSAAEVLYLFFRQNNIEISKPMADCLLTGLVTDTGNLLFSSVNENTIKTSSALLLEGAAMPKIIKRTAQNKSLSAMKIWGKILNNTRYHPSYKLVYSVLSWEEVAALKADFGEVGPAFDAASDILNNVDGAKAALFLREQEPGKIKGSLRSKHPGIDVSKVAEKLGGGGHSKAAAFRFDGHIEKTDGGWRIV